MFQSHSNRQSHGSFLFQSSWHGFPLNLMERLYLFCEVLLGIVWLYWIILWNIITTTFSTSSIPSFKCSSTLWVLCLKGSWMICSKAASLATPEQANWLAHNECNYVASSTFPLIDFDRILWDQLWAAVNSWSMCSWEARGLNFHVKVGPCCISLGVGVCEGI